MLKAKEFKIEDSNIANLGSKADKAVRATASQKEKAWKKIKGKVGLLAWRIEKFKVKPCREAESGRVFNGDSYIFLNTYKDKKNKKKLKFDLHFWLGANTTQDEAGTAAYKTVECDDFVNEALKLGDPVQHRECSGYESGLFLSYFNEGGGLIISAGGIESGFNIVKPETFKPRLLHLKGKKNLRVTQVPIAIESLNSGDVFVLDAGMKLYQFQAKGAGKDEKYRAGKLQRNIDDERKGKPEVATFGQGDEPDEDQQEFWKYFVGGDDLPDVDTCKKCMESIPTTEGGDDEEWEKKAELVLMQLTVDDDSKETTFKEAAKGKLKKDMLKSDDVFILDAGMEIFVWVGSGANAEEKASCMNYASKYLIDNEKNTKLPVTRVIEGDENEVFAGFFKG